MAPALDVHQHLWTEALVEPLARRDRPPRLRHRQGRWRLDIDGEPQSEIVVDDVQARARLVAADGLDGALVALSSALGIETLPGDESRQILEAYRAGVRDLPGVFGHWASVALDRPDPAELDEQLDGGAAGLCLPAAALADPTALARVGTLLERLERRGAPLLVHPGPVAVAAAPATIGVPAWWPAVTAYVAQQAAAWVAFSTHGRQAHPRLLVAFAMLAGLAPLHSERLAVRGAPLTRLDDPRTFYDTSSYGRRAIDAMIAAVGSPQLVHGSDRPVIAPTPEDLARVRRQPLATGNVARLLGRVPPLP